jgi:preprotein translocase subunit Sec63
VSRCRCIHYLLVSVRFSEYDSYNWVNNNLWLQVKTCQEWYPRFTTTLSITLILTKWCFSMHPTRRKPHMYWPADDKKFLLLHYQLRSSQYNKFNIHYECKAIFQYIVCIYPIPIAYSIKLQVGKLMLEHSNWYLAPMICL